MKRSMPDLNFFSRGQPSPQRIKEPPAASLPKTIVPKINVNMNPCRMPSLPPTLFLKKEEKPAFKAKIRIQSPSLTMSKRRLDEDKDAAELDAILKKAKLTLKEREIKIEKMGRPIYSKNKISLSQPHTLISPSPTSSQQFGIYGYGQKKVFMFADTRNRFLAEKRFLEEKKEATKNQHAILPKSSFSTTTPLMKQAPQFDENRFGRNKNLFVLPNNLTMYGTPTSKPEPGAFSIKQEPLSPGVRSNAYSEGKTGPNLPIHSGSFTSPLPPNFDMKLLRKSSPEEFTSSSESDYESETEEEEEETVDRPPIPKILLRRIPGTENWKIIRPENVETEIGIGTGKLVRPGKSEMKSKSDSDPDEVLPKIMPKGDSSEIADMRQIVPVTNHKVKPLHPAVDAGILELIDKVRSIQGQIGMIAYQTLLSKLRKNQLLNHQTTNQSNSHKTKIKPKSSKKPTRRIKKTQITTPKKKQPVIAKPGLIVKQETLEDSPQILRTVLRRSARLQQKALEYSQRQEQQNIKFSQHEPTIPPGTIIIKREPEYWPTDNRVDFSVSETEFVAEENINNVEIHAAKKQEVKLETPEAVRAPKMIKSEVEVKVKVEHLVLKNIKLENITSVRRSQRISIRKSFEGFIMF